MTTLYEELFNPKKMAYSKEFTLIKSSENVYTAEFELAGFSKEDVSITADDEMLSVEAKKGEKVKAFSIALNELVNPSDITSKMYEGLLTLTMPKKQSQESFAVKIE